MAEPSHRPLNADDMRKDQVIHARFALAGYLALSSTAFGFQPLVTDDTGTQGSGGKQLELVMAREKTDADKTCAGSLVYTQGLDDALDAFIELGQQRVDTTGIGEESGPTNPAIGLKWRFYQNEQKTSLAIKSIYVAPLSGEDEDKGLGTGESSQFLSLILTQVMNWGAVHANLNARRQKYSNQDNGPDENITEFSVAPVWNVSEEWQLAIDLGERRGEANGANTRSRFGELGIIFSPTANVDFALGYIEEWDRDRITQNDSKIITGGVTWRFN